MDNKGPEHFILTTLKHTYHFIIVCVTICVKFCIAFEVHNSLLRWNIVVVQASNTGQFLLQFHNKDCITIHKLACCKKKK